MRSIVFALPPSFEIRLHNSAPPASRPETRNFRPASINRIYQRAIDISAGGFSRQFRRCNHSIMAAASSPDSSPGLNIIPASLPLDHPIFIYGVKQPSELGKPSPLIPAGLRTVSSLDPTIPCFSPKQPTPYHNRFHPLIPPVATVAVGELVRAECWDATGGQMKSSTDSIQDMDIYQGELTHVVSGPYNIEGAEPGDAIELEIVEMDVLSGNAWGYTAIPGKVTGFLSDHLTQPGKAIWDLSSRTHAVTDQIPHVKVPRMFHLGVIATAPSQEIVDEINRREKQIWEETGGDQAVPIVACLPSERLAMVGGATGADAEKARKEGLRTIRGFSSPRRWF